jgi:hypothetical protein
MLRVKTISKFEQETSAGFVHLTGHFPVSHCQQKRQQGCNEGAGSGSGSVSLIHLQNMAF